MKAILSTRSGPPEVLHYRDREKPTPGPNELLVRVRGATVARGDVVMRRMPRIVLRIVGALAGFKPMDTPGVEYAGDVVEVGDRVTAFRVGDAVCGTATGLRHGANAEFVCVPERPKQGVIVRKPEAVSYEDSAAAVVGGMTALQLVKRAGVRSGDRVLVNGASGSVGSYVVQLAKHVGAEVTGVCSASNVEMVRSIGADHVIDYTREDFTQGAAKYDVIVDAVGKTSKRRCRGALEADGRYVSSRAPTKEVAEELEYVQKLVESGEIRVVVDSEYPLERIVEAHRYVETGHKHGNVLVRVPE
ncbi:MAG: NAD(P)-dependent alcohol dehydrogenase [Spirochaetota bacterium]